MTKGTSVKKKPPKKEAIVPKAGLEPARGVSPTGF